MIFQREFDQEPDVVTDNELMAPSNNEFEIESVY